MLSSKFCKLFKNTYFLEDLQTAYSENPVRGSFFKKVASLTAWKLLAVLERDSHRYFSVNFDKFLGKLFCRTPSNHFSHVVFFLFADQWGLQPKINSFHGAMVNQMKEFTGLSILCSYGNQVKTSLSSCCHTCTHLGILIAGEVERKENLKNLLICGKFSFHVKVDRDLLTYLKTKKFLFVNY